MRGIGWFFALLGVMAMAAFAAAWGFLKDADLPLWVKLLGGSGPLLIALGAYLERGFLAQVSSDQTTGRTVNAMVASALAFAICVTANVAAHESKWRYDATKNKSYTLSQQSIDLVSKLNREVQVQAFFPKNAPAEKNFKDLMDQYQEHTSLLKVEYHDPNEEPVLAEQEKLTNDQGTVIIKAADKEKRLEYTFDESAVTNALVTTTSDVVHKVCVVSGHGEMDPADASTNSGLGFAKTKLEGQNYAVSTISLTAAPPTPSSCEVVLLGAPQSEMLPDELDRLAQYVAAGGSMIVLLDPSVPPTTVNDFARYGIKPGADVVVEMDPNRIMQNNPVAIILDQSSFEQHPLTAKLKGNSILFMARSISKGADIAGLKVDVIAHGSKDSFGETNLNDPNGKIEPTPGQDIIGDVPLVAAIEVQDPAALRTHTDAVLPSGQPVPAATANAANPLPTKAGGKVVIFGDADFASNQMIASGLNQDLLLNTVAWMAGETDQISIRSNEASKGRLEMSTIGLLLVWLVSMVVMPGVMIMGAVGTWFYRRRL